MRVAVVGTGFSGLCMGIKLREAGFEDFTLFEKAGAIGGTWRDNTYPGAECDIPSALYSYSFEPNPRWTHKWSHQPEILRYMEHCARKHALYPHIRFDTEVRGARWDDDGACWRVSLQDGSEETFDALVTGVGQLSRPFVPDIPGLGQFRGPCFHSARWNHDVELAGRDVVVIGNAASAVQFVPQIAPEVRRLTVLQRSANWMLPKNDREYTEFEKWLGQRMPFLHRLYRMRIWLMSETVLYPMMGLNRFYKWWGARQTRRYIEDAVSDPQLRQKLVPDYPFGAKRILFSDDYYEALDRDNVELVTETIEAVTDDGVRVAGGREIPADVLILATGFRTNPFLAPMEITGTAGRSLRDEWKEGAEAYLGITVAGFPNLFMTYGPNTNLGHSSILIMVECQVRYIVDCLRHMRANGAERVEVREDVQRRYNQILQRRLADKVWARVGRSWYMDHGRITNNWAGRTTEYWWRTKHFDENNYRLAS
ncbi:MAG: NAD(P)/FAD-dependent oxidoreductase [Gammaproteobacteria bacterium]